MKLPILLSGLLMCIGVAFAEDSMPQLVERKTCAEIKTEIDNLSFIENPDDAILAKLKQLQTQQRSNCVAKSAGRRRVIRNVPTGAASQVADTVVLTSDALSEYLANKKSNCDKLNSEIEKLTMQNDVSASDMLASMRGVYDMDCETAANLKPETKPNVPEKTEDELNAEYDANIMAGLCGDGTKPNRYGCCTGETFKDLGNATFACCPAAGSMCFPPIK